MASSKGDTINLSTLHSFLSRNSTPTSQGGTVVSYSHDIGNGPVLWLVHGYPQSAYIFRHLAPRFKDKVSLFIPELPGYGISSAPHSPARSAVGASVLEASHALFPNRPIILAGHDRGARLCHRLAVAHAHPPSDARPLHQYRLLGTVLLDIVPTLVQWRAFADPAASAAYFHWPFLASAVAPDMIEAYGGARWCREALDRIGGGSDAARAAFTSDDAWAVYESLNARRDYIEGSCADYRAAVHPEPAEQDAEQKAGRKLDVPVLVMWSLGRLGKMHGDVGAIWKDWVKEGTDLTTVGCGDDVGHYLPEEANEVVGKAMDEFLDKVLK
ncbi:hypothetical protein MBLNU459_g4706t1 [Dothideomycetes sp. NU459]